MGLFICNPSNLFLGPWFSVHLPWTSLETRSQFNISCLWKSTFKGKENIFCDPKAFPPNFPQMSSRLPWVSYLRNSFESLPCHFSYIRNTEFQEAQIFRLAKGKWHQPGPYLSFQEPSSGPRWLAFFRLFGPLWHFLEIIWVKCPLHAEPKKSYDHAGGFLKCQGSSPALEKRPTLEKKHLGLCTGTLLLICGNHKNTEIH